ncbi:MAG: hypothetical protein JJ964_10655 [Rhizobiales bacterium]|nr:hypothetical protein [Hyphomicrobiales bacterium]
MSTSIAASAVANQQAQTQLAVAAKIAKFNAASERSVVDLVNAAQANLEAVTSSAGPGKGAVLDISV